MTTLSDLAEPIKDTTQLLTPSRMVSLDLPETNAILKEL